jgi:hypothetical protein
MASKSLRVRYRPIRIGWCVEDGNLNEFRRAARLTHTLSGGKFNPIIPVGSNAARALVEHFRVDVLFPIETTEASLSFIGSFPHLTTPHFDQRIFDNYMGRMEPNYLDISHWLDELAHDLGRPEADPSQPASSSPELNPYGLVHWTQGDPLEDVLLATFGAYPPPMGIGRDYVRFIIDNLRPAIYDAKIEESIPSYLLKQMTASSISTLDLNWDRIPSQDSAGFYAGRSDNFVDLVNYWNMRAADMNVLFLDPNHLNRLEQLRDDQIQFILRRDMSAEFPRTINVWSREQELAAGVGIHPSALPTFFVVDGISAMEPGIRPPLHYFRNRSVLGPSFDDPADPTLAVQLPEKPFDAHEELSQQHFVVSIHPPIEDADSEHTLWTPHIPELNHWYGIQLVSQSRFLRVETEGFGIISSITDESLEVSLIKRLDLARKLFEYAGIEAQPNVPGRIASRLIRQLGGLQGCRVLKIAGVRKLIKEYGPLKEFGRTVANSIIGNRDLAAGTGDFSAYEDLYIRPRQSGQKKLKPEDAFLYLLDKGAFRVGLTLTCSVCDLQFWAALDNVAELMTCEVCGSRFDIKRQLKDRDWMYRRSGLFGKDNNQEGSIPVALTLQQLSANLRSSYSGSMFITNLTLKPVSAQIEPCETDLFVAIQAHETVQVIVGECKDSGGSITGDDARKMAAVADAFPREHFDPYVLFSKTAPFTDDDIANCGLAQPKYSRQRVIMLTDRELESHQIFERAAQDLQLRNPSGTLENMAEMTRQIYFSGRKA